MTRRLEPNEEGVDDTLVKTLRIFPALTFHYGMGFAELCDLPNIVLRMYVDALPGLLAQRELTSLRASMFPHLEQSDRRDILNEISDTVRGDAPPPPKPSKAEFKQRLQGHGFGFEERR